MDDVTIISYPGERSDSLLSLTQDRSKYLLPFGGRFRVADFTVRNSLAAEARRTIIFSDIADGLEDYVHNYGDFRNEKFPRIKVVASEKQDIQICYKLVMDSNTGVYAIYNGDNPSIIDFPLLVKRFRKSRKHTVLYKMNFDGHASLANTVLVTKQKPLLAVINRAVDEKREAPNVFEMLVNILVNRGIETSTFHVRYWPVRNVPEYYAYQMDVLKKKEIFDLFYREAGLAGHITHGGIARLGMHAKIMKSVVADGCDINGTVLNSIVYPGVVIGEGAYLKDCVLLPGVVIGARSRLYRTIMDERTASGSPENPAVSLQNVGEHCHVGSETEGLKNNDYPRSIFNGITLLGKNCVVPHSARVGGACYVGQGLGQEYFIKSRTLYDGTSIKR